MKVIRRQASGWPFCCTRPASETMYAYSNICRPQEHEAPSCGMYAGEYQALSLRKAVPGAAGKHRQEAAK